MAWNSKRPWENPIRRYMVLDANDEPHYIVAHVGFNNNREGLIFRMYPRGSNTSKVVACFADGGWQYYKEIEFNGEE